MFFYFRRPEFFRWRLLYIPSRRTGRQTRTGTTSLKKKKIKKKNIHYYICRMSLLQRYNSENHYVIISHIHINIIQPSAAHTRFLSPAAATTRGNYTLVRRMQNTLFFFIFYFCYFILYYYSITRNEYTPS